MGTDARGSFGAKGDYRFGDAIRPFYLPGGRLVFALRTAKGFQLQSARLVDSKALEEIEPAGSRAILPLTYLNASAIPADVLADGRILFEAGFPLGSDRLRRCTWSIRMGRGLSRTAAITACPMARRWGGKQLASGDVVFTHGASLARFHIAAGARRARCCSTWSSTRADCRNCLGRWLLSARESENAHFAFRLWKPGAASLETVLARSGDNLVEPVLVAPRDRPRSILPHCTLGTTPTCLRWMRAFRVTVRCKGTPASVRLETQDAAVMWLRSAPRLWKPTAHFL